MSARRVWRWCLLLAVLAQPALLARAAGSFFISQSGRAFSVAGIRIKRGDTIHFKNNDEFLHQLYVSSPSFSFSSAEQETGQVVDIRFPASGTFQVGCEIHPKMALTVTVE